MKTSHKYILIACALTALAGCAKDDAWDGGGRIIVQPPVVENCGTRAIIGTGGIVNWYRSNGFYYNAGASAEIGFCIFNEGGTTQADGYAPGYHNVGVYFNGNGSAVVNGGYVVDGKKSDYLAARSGSKVDIYSYYPYDAKTTDVNAIEFTTASDAPITYNNINEPFPKDYMVAERNKGVVVTEGTGVAPAFSHVMSAVYLSILTPASQATVGVSKMTIGYSDGGNTITDPTGKAKMIPLGGTYSAVDGSVTVTSWTDKLEHKYSGWSLTTNSNNSKFVYILPEMLADGVNYPEDAVLSFTLTLNQDESEQREPYNATFRLPLSALTTPPAAGAKKGLVRGYVYSIGLTLYNYRHFTLDGMKIQEWDNAEPSEIDM